MPQFVLDMGSADGAHNFNQLDSFTQGYVEAAFWTSEEELEGATVADLSPQAWDRILRDCSAFQAARPRDLELAEERYGRDLSHSGHDFWLTRNGHGTGFWDRDMGAVGDSLDSLACTFRECDLYVGDDGRVYMS